MIKSMRISERSFVIFGANSPLASALCILLAKEKANLLLFSKDEERLNALQKECASYGARCIATSVDLSDLGKVSSLATDVIKREKQIEGIFFFAAENYYGYTPEVPIKEFKRLLDINFFSTLVTLSSLWEKLKAQPSCNVFLVSSGTSFFAPPLEGHYSISKAMLGRYAETLRFEAMDTNIRITTVFPPTMASKTLNSPKVFGSPPIRDLKRTTYDAASAARSLHAKINKGAREIHLGRTSKLVKLMAFLCPSILYQLLKPATAKDNR